MSDDRTDLWAFVTITGIGLTVAGIVAAAIHETQKPKTKPKEQIPELQSQVIELKPLEKGENPMRHNRRVRRTVNILSEAEVGRIISDIHICPRCYQRLIFLSLSRARGLHNVVKVCERCNHRQGWTILNGRMERVF